jgi:hypothetical protein
MLRKVKGPEPSGRWCLRGNCSLCRPEDDDQRGKWSYCTACAEDDDLRATWSRSQAQNSDKRGNQPHCLEEDNEH